MRPVSSPISLNRMKDNPCQHTLNYLCDGSIAYPVYGITSLVFGAWASHLARSRSP